MGYMFLKSEDSIGENCARFMQKTETKLQARLDDDMFLVYPVISLQ